MGPRPEPGSARGPSNPAPPLCSSCSLLSSPREPARGERPGPTLYLGVVIAATPTFAPAVVGIALELNGLVMLLVSLDVGTMVGLALASRDAGCAIGDAGALLWPLLAALAAGFLGGLLVDLLA